MTDLVDKDQWIRGRSNPVPENKDAESMQEHDEFPEICVVGPHPDTQRKDCRWRITVENSDGSEWSVPISEPAAMALRDCGSFQVQPYK